MSVRDIIEEGNPILREQMPDIDDPKEITRITRDLKDTMKHSNAAGFAANQIGERANICLVWEATDYQRPNKKREIYTLVNPKIVSREGSRPSTEGCFSIPGYIAIIPRSRLVKIACKDRLYIFSGVESWVAQHEIEHLQGILIRDYVEETNGKSGGVLLAQRAVNQPVTYKERRERELAGK